MRDTSRCSCPRVRRLGRLKRAIRRRESQFSPRARTREREKRSRTRLRSSTTADTGIGRRADHRSLSTLAGAAARTGQRPTYTLAEARCSPPRSPQSPGFSWPGSRGIRTGGSVAELLLAWLGSLCPPKMARARRHASYLSFSLSPARARGSPGGCCQLNAAAIRQLAARVSRRLARTREIRSSNLRTSHPSPRRR